MSDGRIQLSETERIAASPGWREHRVEVFDISVGRVIAKGQDFIALKIGEIASENQVPIVEKPELARALYRLCDIDDFIPDDFWTPVAELLAYVYSIDQRKRDRALKDGVPA